MNIADLKCNIFNDVTILPQLSVGITGKQPLALFACGAYSEGKALSHVHGLPGAGRVNAQLPYIEAKNIIAEEVIFGGEFLGYWGHWGHFLLETLQRLWYAKNKNLPIAWIVPEVENGDPAYFYTARHEEVLHNLGIDNEHILITEPTKFNIVHFPEPGLSITGYAHPKHIEFLGYHEGNVNKGRFVYLSRSRYDHCINEKNVEELLKNMGWEIVFPEDLSAHEQLEIMTSAEVCMMISGSAQHSLLLTKNSKTLFIVIPRIHNHIYDVIAHFKSDNYYLLHVDQKISNSNTPSNRNKFSIDINLLQSVIAETKNFTLNLENFAQILKKPNEISLENSIIPDSYYNHDCTITPIQEYFYKAIFLYRSNMLDEAYKILMHLYNKNMLEFYMYDYFFTIIEKHDETKSIKTDLHYDKKQFFLERAKNNLTNNPENAEYYVALARQFQELNNNNDAIKTLNHAIKKFPKWGVAYAYLAKIYLAKNDTRLALSNAQKAFKLDPSIPNIKQVLMQCMYLNDAKKS